MTSLVDRLRQSALSWLFGTSMGGDDQWRERYTRYIELQAYREGVHRRQIAAKPGQADDNLTENIIGLIVDRSVSAVLGDGIRLALPDEEQQQLLDEIADANDLQMLLHDAAENASIYGTAYLKILPAAVESVTREDVMLPRVIVLDPRWMRIVTPPDDIGRVIGYDMHYTADGVARREETRIAEADDLGRIKSWIVRMYESSRSTSGRWQMIAETLWSYEFPPILHWKNLPRANDCYGRSDIELVLELQDRLNFVSSNISRIIRYHAHPRTWMRGGGVGGKASWGPDEMIVLSGDNAMVSNLEMQSDLASSRAFYNDLRAAIFDVSRTVDLATMKDRVGQLTNFGLRVLYMDELARITTKRALMERALLELVHRLLVIEGVDPDPGAVYWPEILPINESERNDVNGFDLDRGLVSKQTVAEARGYDWEREQERIAEERQGEETVGAAILRAFQRGQV